MSAPLPATLVELLRQRVTDSPHLPALVAPQNGQFSSLAWSELSAQVDQLAAALLAVGVQPGDRVVQISENRVQWIVTDLAIHAVGGIHVAVHAALSGPQMAFQILDTEPRLVLVSGSAQIAALDAVDTDWPPGLRWFSYDPPPGVPSRLPFRPLEELLAAGAHVSPHSLAAASASVGPDSLATILYSSGTTGEPKGVMLTHGNLTTNALACVAAHQTEPADLRLCWLPLSHIFARTADLYAWIARGSRMALAESREKIIANCGQLRPALINGVPYFYDKVYRYAASQNWDPDTARCRLPELFGGRLRMACSGGAPLSDSVWDYFNRAGVPLFQGYGLTETSPVITTCIPAANRVGSVGQPVEGVEVRIAPDGEILTRGPHVMRGYWKRPDDTADVLVDGWLCTGDLGRLDSDGFLYITGRKKEIIVTAGGKNIAPNYLERLLTEDPLIQQALIVGDRRNFLAALIVPNREELARELTRRGLPPDRLHALDDPGLVQLYRERIDSRLSVVAHCEQIGAFCLLPRPFSVEHDELTPTLKLRRRAIEQHFASEIERLYAD